MMEKMTLQEALIIESKNFSPDVMDDNEVEEFKNGFNIGTKSGQVKERQNLQPLIDAVADLDQKAIHTQLSNVTMKVITEYRKIKPLKTQ